MPASSQTKAPACRQPSSNRTLTLTERTASGTVVHSDTVAAGQNGTFAVTGGDTVVLTVPAD
ncbi:hypothetical protein ACF081_27050 [Streptomyces longwoodensis]|uniref:hypothetical protein n=1 Tax=Streptomyces longwoodensis TaxID=68231 RepID=UPI0036FB708B